MPLPVIFLTTVLNNFVVAGVGLGFQPIITYWKEFYAMGYGAADYLQPVPRRNDPPSDYVLTWNVPGQGNTSHVFPLGVTFEPERWTWPSPAK